MLLGRIFDHYRYYSTRYYDVIESMYYPNIPFFFFFMEAKENIVRVMRWNSYVTFVALTGEKKKWNKRPKRFPGSRDRNVRLRTNYFLITKTTSDPFKFGTNQLFVVESRPRNSGRQSCVSLCGCHCLKYTHKNSNNILIIQKTGKMVRNKAVLTVSVNIKRIYALMCTCLKYTHDAVKINRLYNSPKFIWYRHDISTE